MSRTDIACASTLHRAPRPNQVWSWDITWKFALVAAIAISCDRSRREQPSAMG
jgi:hypothetical protein